MPQVFTNLDAAFLSELSSKLAGSDAHTAARLVAIAGNLQRLDERSTSSYSRGFLEGKDAVVNQNSNLRPKDGPADLAEALKIWDGEVSKLPPVTKENHKSVLTTDDLDIDDDMDEYILEAQKRAEDIKRRKHESNSSAVRNKA